MAVPVAAGGAVGMIVGAVVGAAVGAPVGAAVGAAVAAPPPELQAATSSPTPRTSVVAESLRMGTSCLGERGHGPVRRAGGCGFGRPRLRTSEFDPPHTPG